ncbi:MAG: Ig-like domain-containing protein, partial [Clostridium sp.]|uniref:hypothetical protein n=1 Tax=Clostridium sp. TaxID=1506 RepID=UPI002FC9E85F
KLGTHSTSAALVAKCEALVSELGAKLSVSSVEAINAKQLVVKFTKPVDAKTVLADPKLPTTTLKNSVISMTSLEATPATVTLDDTVAAELNEAGTELTITAKSTEVFKGRYDVVIAKGAVTDLAGDAVEKFEATIKAEDKVAPKVVKTEKVNSSKTNIVFSEPMKSEGTVSYKLADGTAIDSGASGYEIVSTLVGNKLEVSVNGAKLINKEIVVTMVGAKDFADNLTAVNPLSVNVTKGDKDGVAPTVKSVKAISPVKLEIEFAEEVTGFAKEHISGVVVASGAEVVQDKTNKAKYTVEVEKMSGLKFVTIAHTASVSGSNVTITDLSGEAMTKAFEARLDVVADTVAPTVKSSKIVKGALDNAEYLEIEMSEDVTVVPTTGDITLAAKASKDYVTTPGNITFAVADLDPVGESKTTFRVKLESVNFKAAALVEGTTYNVDLVEDIFADVSGNKNIAAKGAFEFTRGKDGIASSIDAQTVASIASASNDTITVKFGKEVDGKSATTASNYSVEGAVVEKAELAADLKTVTLTIKKNSNTFSGARYITVDGVKTQSGVGMEKAHKEVITLKENVRPELVSAVLSGAQTITLTFSEGVKDAASAVDFELYVAGVKVTTENALAITVDADNKTKATITLQAGIDAATLAKGVTLKSAGTMDITDLNDNKLEAISSITVK